MDVIPQNHSRVRGTTACRRLSTSRACIIFLCALLFACNGSSGSDTSTAIQSADTAGSDTDQTRQPPAQDPATGDSSAYNLGSTSQGVIDQCMSQADKQMLSQVNSARAVARSCGDQFYPPAAALSWHCTLEDVAYAHSRDMGDHNFFSHTGSDGLSVGERVTNAGYIWTAVGENIAAGQLTIDAVMTDWLDSPGHCANIMRPAYTEFGAASYIVTGSDYPIYWTQVFAAPRR